MQGFVVVDLETTGLDPMADRIVEIGLIELDDRGQKLAEWQWLVNPDRPMGAQFIHGISDDDVAFAPPFSVVAPQLADLLRGRAVVGHNVRFDVSFLNAEFARAGISFAIPSSVGVCTMDLSRIYLPDGRHRLADCAERAGVSSPITHRALADAQCTAALFTAYLRMAKQGVRVNDVALTRRGDIVIPGSWIDAQITASLTARRSRGQSR